MEIRPAQPENAVPAAELIALSMGEFGDQLFGLGDPLLCRLVLEKLFRQPGNRFSYPLVDLAWVDGVPAGLLLGFPGKEYLKLNLGVARRIPGVFGLGDTVKFLRLALLNSQVKECAADEYYVGHLAVAPTFQRQGIGRRLLEQAVKKARQLGLSKCSLTVDTNNPTAQRLYKNFGYRIVETTDLSRHQAKLHTSGVQRMILEISEEES